MRPMLAMFCGAGILCYVESLSQYKKSNRGFRKLSRQFGILRENIKCDSGADRLKASAYAQNRKT